AENLRDKPSFTAWEVWRDCVKFLTTVPDQILGRFSAPPGLNLCALPAAVLRAPLPWSSQKRLLPRSAKIPRAETEVNTRNLVSVANVAPNIRRNRMFLSPLRRLTKRVLPASRPIRRGSRSSNLRCEELEPRLQLSAFVFSTGLPDGKIGTITEPSSAHTGQVEFESADDFILNSETRLTHATFTGLLTGGATPQDISNVVVEIYRVFPNDSDVGRTSGPPTFSTDRVPTRVNSPSDVAFDSRNSAENDLLFQTQVLN